MKIFSFPQVVLYELMKEFKPSELLNLSLCSKNALTLVKTFSKADEHGSLKLSSHEDGYSVSYGTLRILVTSKINRTIWDLKSIHGIEYLFDWSRQLHTFWEDVVHGCKETTNYIRDLFKVPVSRVTIDEEADMWMLEFAQKQQEQKLEIVKIDTRNMSAQDYSKVLSCNVTESLECVPKPPQDYRFDGKLPSVKNLFVYNGAWITREQVLGMESQNAHLAYTNLTNSDINAVLKSWLNGGLPNMKSLKINGQRIDDEVYEGLGDRLERVQGEHIYTWSHHEMYFMFNFRGAFHLRRADNVVASVVTVNQLITIAVWPDLNGNRV